MQKKQNYIVSYKKTALEGGTPSTVSERRAVCAMSAQDAIGRVTSDISFDLERQGLFWTITAEALLAFRDFNRVVSRYTDFTAAPQDGPDPAEERRLSA